MAKKEEPEFMSFDELIATHDLHVIDPDEKPYWARHQRRSKIAIFFVRLDYAFSNIWAAAKEELWRLKKF